MINTRIFAQVCLVLTAAPLLIRESKAFAVQPCHLSSSPLSEQKAAFDTSLRYSTDEGLHPAVEGWPEKYGKDVVGGTFHPGPRILHEVFTVEKATPAMLVDLDVEKWPTWTTSDKEKWAVGNQNINKIMPYGELSYMITGRLEIVQQATGQAVVVEPGDFVTFPKDFVASWKVLEEVTWHYYLY